MPGHSVWWTRAQCDLHDEIWCHLTDWQDDTCGRVPATNTLASTTHRKAQDNSELVPFVCPGQHGVRVPHDLHQRLGSWISHWRIITKALGRFHCMVGNWRAGAACDWRSADVFRGAFRAVVQIFRFLHAGSPNAVRRQAHR